MSQLLPHFSLLSRVQKKHPNSKFLGTSAEKHKIPQYRKGCKPPY